MRPRRIVFKGTDLQNHKYLITIDEKGVFMHHYRIKANDIEFTWDEIFKMGQVISTRTLGRER